MFHKNAFKMQIIYMSALILLLNLNKQPVKYIYMESFKAISCLELEKLRVQFKMSNNWPVKSNQVSKIVCCTCAEIRKFWVFWQKYVPKKILLTGWKFQLNISGDSEVIEKFCHNYFNPANPPPNTFEGLKLGNLVKECTK